MKKKCASVLVFSFLIGSLFLLFILSYKEVPMYNLEFILKLIGIK